MQRRSFTKEFKTQVVQEILSGRTPSEVARDHDLKSTLVSRWNKEQQQNQGYAFSGHGVPSKEDTRNAALERKIGQLTMEIDFVKKVNNNLQNLLAEEKKTRRLQ